MDASPSQNARKNSKTDRLGEDSLLPDMPDRKYGGSDGLLPILIRCPSVVEERGKSWDDGRSDRQLHVKPCDLLA